MAALFRWALRIVTAGLVILALVLGFVYYFAARSLPDYNASFQLDGIAGPVEILRDTSNVPHVFATADADVFFGLGY